MKAITEYSPAEYEQMRKKHAALLNAIKDAPHDGLIAICRQRGYAHYKFNGVYTPWLVELLGRHPDEDEIIMLVDGGFSHFGATCSVRTESMHFAGRVNID